MNGLIQNRLIVVVVATVMFGGALAADTVSDEPAVKHDKTSHGNQRSNKNKSNGIENRDSNLAHQERAVSESDFKALADSEPGVDVDRVENVKPVESGAKAEAMDPAKRRVPQTLGHRDRTAKSEKGRDKQ